MGNGTGERRCDFASDAAKLIMVGFSFVELRVLSGE
jgi:hypothetical protein